MDPNFLRDEKQDFGNYLESDRKGSKNCEVSIYCKSYTLMSLDKTECLR